MIERLEDVLNNNVRKVILYGNDDECFSGSLESQIKKDLKNYAMHGNLCKLQVTVLGMKKMLPGEMPVRWQTMHCYQSVVEEL